MTMTNPAPIINAYRQLEKRKPVKKIYRKIKWRRGELEAQRWLSAIAIVYVRDGLPTREREHPMSKKEFTKWLNYYSDQMDV